MDSRVQEIARRVRELGGRSIAVGGWVRDRLRGQPSKDLDVEIFGLSLEQTEDVLSGFGDVIAVGRAFGVFRLKDLDVDFSLPRTDSKVGRGHRGFSVAVEPNLTFAEAARRRDLTINSMGVDVLTDELLDPFNGSADLEAGRLRATDSAHFSEDPLRGLRAAQFAARLDMEPDEELLTLCRALDLSEISGERVFEEFRKLLLKGERPSRGLSLLRDGHLIRYFPELAALIGVEQEPEWHPEGDVWVHTLMVVDEAARLRRDEEDDLALMFGALCHDFGKPATTRRERGAIRSPAHDVEGVEPTQTFLERMRAPGRLTRQVSALVRHHLDPALFVRNGATDKAYRRLARKLESAGISFELLLAVATADHFGRTTPEALARQFPAGETFLTRAHALVEPGQASEDVVKGRHLIARGLRPGPEFAQMLARCRDVQDETGWTDPDAILERALGEG